MKIKLLDKIGAIGALLAASACPFCFPLLASAGLALGLGFLRPYEGIMIYALQIFAGFAFIGNIVAFLSHKKIIPLFIGAISPLAIFFALYIRFIPLLVYLGLFGLFISSLLNYIENKKCKSCKRDVGQKEIILHSKIKCPFCGYVREEKMSLDSCQHFYECSNCKKILQPKTKDCCVFCSYGSVTCPPKQKK